MHIIKKIFVIFWWQSWTSGCAFKNLKILHSTATLLTVVFFTAAFQLIPVLEIVERPAYIKSLTLLSRMLNNKNNTIKCCSSQKVNLYSASWTVLRGVCYECTCSKVTLLIYVQQRLKHWTETRNKFTAEYHWHSEVYMQGDGKTANQMAGIW